MDSSKADKPTVWIIHDKGPGYDFSQAAAHGNVKTVFKGEFNPFDLHSAQQQAQEVLATSTPDDWLVGVGSGIASMIVAMEFVRRHGRLPILVYHTQRHEYVKRDLTGLKL